MKTHYGSHETPFLSFGLCNKDLIRVVPGVKESPTVMTVPWHNPDMESGCLFPHAQHRKRTRRSIAGFLEHERPKRAGERNEHRQEKGDEEGEVDDLRDAVHKNRRNPVSISPALSARLSR